MNKNIINPTDLQLNDETVVQIKEYPKRPLVEEE